MITYQKRNILDINQDPFIIAHGCNVYPGVMGSGCALAIKKKYPGAYKEYKRQLDNKQAKLGDVIWYQLNDYSYIANCLTQQTIGSDKRQVDYDAFYDCIENVLVFAKLHNFKVVHMVPIGAGLALGKWCILSKIIYTLSEQYAIDIEVSIFDQSSYDEFSKFTY